MPIEKDYLNLAGEYRVCEELLKRQLFATITYGNKKGVDIFAIGENQRVATIEIIQLQQIRDEFLSKVS